MKKLSLALAMTVALMSAHAVSAEKKPVTAGTPSLEQRLERLERILRNQSLADIILQLQQLQQEVQQLRGEVELQKHSMDAMSRRQRDLYLDIDQRLSRMNRSTTVSSAPAPVVDLTGSGAAAAKQSVPTVEKTSGAKPTAVVAVTPKVSIDSKKESAAYQKAFNLLKQGRYKESIVAFGSFLKKFPGGSYEDNAQYWLGESSYVSRDFDTALSEFTKVIEHYPDSAKVPGAMLKSGYIHYEKRAWTMARDLFERLKKQYSGTTEARLAANRLDRMFKEGH
ncbi:MAG: tol-pal system protein YbgF [endosymbiont of Seepiophila jonesi]|uniref:Cell division coordinator CpoB n=1 Tax=endosymbiont of Lamellibrachia luymesi TaxID=2200907 RepID=A0A370E2P7_9GAMM|nr:MAG: tol-pal system protein YbgF [endosymbiont of Lamellibrachia luymesi]RDH93749.1 MAG: tol-pal system protein YbgF [endosymbiont of Seepiophila jonesi]